MRLFNKIKNTLFQPSDCEQYKYDCFNYTHIDHVFDSSFLEIAQVTLNWIIDQDKTSTYLCAPSFWRKKGYDVTVGVSNIDANNWFRLRLNRDSFYPISTVESSSFLSTILGNKHLLNYDDKLIIKLNIKKRLGDWRGDELEKYDYFLKGNTLATENKIIRFLLKQQQCDSNQIIKPIIDIEKKIINEQYYFDCLVGITSRTNKQMLLLENLIHLATDSLSGLNTISVESASENHESFYYSQFLSREELISFVYANDHIEITNNIIPPLINNDLENDGDTMFGLLPRSNKEETVEGEYVDISDRIIQSLKRVGVSKSNSFKLDGKIMNGLSFVRCQYKIPKDTTYTKVADKHKDIRVSLGVPSLTIEQGSKPDTMAILIPKENKQAIYLGDIFHQQNVQKEMSDLELPILIGINPLGEPIITCVNQLTHILLAGQTGGGKSEWLNQAILSMLIQKSPEELRMILIDPKKVEFGRFKDFPHIDKVETDPNQASIILDKLILEMEERYVLFEKNDVRDIKGYNSKNNKKIPYIICVVDEFADLRMANTSVVDQIATLGQKARAAGIHLIIATQRPDTKIIDGFIKDNLPSKISFRLSTNKSYTTIFGTGIPFDLLGRGHGVMKIEGQIKEFEQFQGAVISLDSNEEERVYKNLIRYIKKYGYKKNENVMELDNDPLIKLKKIIANTGETRVRQLREIMGTRPNVITDLMKRLVEEGWITKLVGNKGYEIILDEDELIKWRE